MPPQMGWIKDVKVLGFSMSMRTHTTNSKPPTATNFKLPFRVSHTNLLLLTALLPTQPHASLAPSGPGGGITRCLVLCPGV